VNKLKPGQILEITKGANKGAAWAIQSVNRGKAVARNENGQERAFTRDDVMER
jgi:hypothetical protein